MALVGSKQLNPRLTGSFTISGSLIGDTSSTGSFGELNVFGNSSIAGDLTLGGDIQIGDSTGDSITITADFTSNLIPNVDKSCFSGSFFTLCSFNNFLSLAILFSKNSTPNSF